MTSRTAAWQLVALVGAALAGCGGQAFSVAPGGGTGVSSGSSSGSMSSGGGGTGHNSGASGESGASAGSSSGGSTGSESGSSSGGQSGASTGTASGAHSGSSAAGSTGASSGASGSSGGSSGSSPTASCPIVAPNEGSVCPKPGLQCEYGASPDLRCNQLAVCQTGTAGWVYNQSTKCPEVLCPVAYEQITPGGACMPADATCAYPKGTCVCSSGSGGPVRLVEGGIAIDWACFPSTLSCRSPRPHMGDACTEENRICDYGACSGGIEIQCVGGLWQEVAVACAV